MTKKNMYYFKDRYAHGINLVPNNSLVEVVSNLHGKTEFFTLIHKKNLTNASTIADVFRDKTQFVPFAIEQDITYNYAKNTLHFHIVK